MLTSPGRVQRALLRRVTGLLRGGPFAGTILLTHLHWDHVHGLPFFVAGDRDDARITLLLPEQEAGNRQSAGAEDMLARGMVAAEASFGHPAADYAVGLARRAAARRVLLPRHKPDRTDDAIDELAARFRADPRVAVAAEGQVVDL